MKLSVEIILIIIIGIIILFNACSENEHFADVAGTTIAGADIDAIRNLNSYAKTLMQPNGTLTNPGNLTVSDKLEVLGGSKLVVQNNQDGGSGNGIYMWNKNDSNWGIYMSTHGDNKSLANGKACSSNNITGHAMRFRSYGGPHNGFIFENHSEQPVMAINSNTGDLQVAGKLSIPGFGDVANTLGRISAVQVFDLNGPNNTADYIRASNLSAQFTLPSGTKILIVNWQGFYYNNPAETRFSIINQSNGATPWSFTFNGNGNTVHVGQSIIKVIPDTTLPTGNYKLKVDTDMGVDRDYLNAAIITLPP